MFPKVWLLAFAIVGVGAVRANDTLAHAREAQALLGPSVWSSVVAIDNDAKLSRYPARLHALVFEMSGVLWLYTSVDGTQSFSLHRGRLAEEKADFGPLLRDIERGFRRWRIVANEDEPAQRRGSGALPNGCFVESVAAWIRRVAAGEELEAPQLLSYYVDTAGGRMGHTVLTYATPSGVEVIDAATGQVSVFPAELRADAEGLARRLRGPDVARARWLALELPRALSQGARVAAGEGTKDAPATSRRRAVG